MKSFFYKVWFRETKFYEASYQLTPEKRWTRIQNDYIYRPQTLPTLLRSIFDSARVNNEIPKFAVVTEQVAKVEPKVRVKKEKVLKEKKEKVLKEKRERIKLTEEQKREHRLNYDRENADKIKAKRKEHYELNKEKLLQDKQTYHQKNRDKIIQQKRDYRLANKEKISIQKKEKYQRKKLEKEIEKKIEFESIASNISN